MQLVYGGLTLTLLGDPHLGKRFRNGVPLDRRGEREESQWADFEESLAEACDAHVCMGDIFDDSVHPYEVVMRAARLYRAACVTNPDRPYFLIRGNHDAWRDLERVSAFDILCSLLADLVNFHGVIDSPVGCKVKNVHLTFIPWHPINTAAEMAEAAPWGEIAFGHWDIVTVHDDHNKIPTEVLARKGVKVVITGHDHLPGELEMDGCRVIKTGSMQPYSHAEDPDALLYVTMTAEDVRRAEPEALKNMCVRVRLAAGETFDEIVNCLQLTTQREGQEEDEDVDVSVEYQEFDFGKLLAESLSEAGVSDPNFMEQTQRRIDDARLKKED